MVGEIVGAPVGLAVGSTAVGVAVENSVGILDGNGVRESVGVNVGT